MQTAEGLSKQVGKRQACTVPGVSRSRPYRRKKRQSARGSSPRALSQNEKEHVSNDNPYSEAQFRTMKYRSDYSSRFGCQQDAYAWAKAFFGWYNYEHHHTGLVLLTPADAHFHRAQSVPQKRQAVLEAAYAKTPERFVKGVPTPMQVPQAVWINPPKPAQDPRNENENSHCKSAVPVPISFGAEFILPEPRL